MVHLFQKKKKSGNDSVMRKIFYNKLNGAFNVLTLREKQIVAAILNEMRVFEIASEFNIKHNTVSTFK